MKQGDKTRQRIIESADRLFYHNGYVNTPFSQICEATGLSKGNVTYHFKNKQTILEAIIGMRLERIDAALRQWERTSEDPIERLRMFCEMLVHEGENLRSYGCPMGTLTEEFAKNTPELYQVVLPMFERYREWLRRQIVQAGVPEANADAVAMHLLSRVQGISVVTHAFKDIHFLKREIAALQQAMAGIVSGAWP